MESSISLLVFNNGQGYDITQLVQKIQWKGRKGSAARSLTATIIDDDGFKRARSGINVEDGWECLFRENGEELFQGLIMSQTQSDKKILKFTAYDIGIALSNNKDTFCYEGKTASDIFRDCCTRFNIPMGEVAECTYKIPELTKSKTTAWDAIADALSLDFKATGIRHYVSCAGGKVSLLTRRENILQWVIETGQNLSAYSHTRSIENIATRVRVVSKEGATLAERSNTALEGKIGIFQEVETAEESLSEAQLNELIDGILNEKGTPERSLTVTATGISSVISGVGVFSIIPELGLSRTFYVDGDTHTYEGNKHTMSLTLNYANDLANEAKGAAAENAKNYSVGDVVQFNGGHHYVSSSAGTPAGSKCAAGPAKITLIAKGAKHPWHLIHTDGSSRVYGWVDDGTFS